MKKKFFTFWMGLMMIFLVPGIYGQVIVNGIDQGASYSYDGSDVDSVVVMDGGTFNSNGNELKFANNGTACYLHVHPGGYLKTGWTSINMYVKDAHTVVFDSAATVDFFDRITMRDNSVLENNAKGVKFGSIELSAYNSGGADMTIKGEEPLWINELHLTNRNNMNIQMEQDIRIDELIKFEKDGGKLSLNGNNLKVEGNAEVQAYGETGYIDASGMGTISVMANGANAELFVNNKMDTVKLSTNAGADLKTNAYVNLQFFDQAVDNTLTDYLGKYVSISYNDSVTTPDFNISVNNIIANEQLTGDAENLYSALYDTAAGEWMYGELLVGDSIHWSGDISGYLTARSLPRPIPVDYSPAQQEDWCSAG